MVLAERVAEAQRLAKIELKELDDKRRGSGRTADDSEEAVGLQKRVKKQFGGGKNVKKFKKK